MKENKIKNAYKIIKGEELLFEDIKHIDEFGNEFWYARELMPLLEYSKWQKFTNVIEQAKVSCDKSDYMVEDHFTQVGKMVEIGSNTTRKIIDYKLTRYACYLIAQNGDSRKKAIALAQTYFAVQTRKQELLESEYDKLPEDKKRIRKRNDIRNGNYDLNRTAINSGVKDLSRFHNAGYKGLYNGETADDIAKRKGIRYREEILDNMSSDELIANSFRISLTNQKLKRDKVDNEYTANSVHYEVGKKIRKTIEELGGIMPEDLPTPDKSIKELEIEENKKLKDNSK